MTLREMFPDWWCKITFSVPENCSGDYNWLDLSIYEFIFTVVIVLVIKWIIYCFFFIIGLIIPDKTVDATIISPTLAYRLFDPPSTLMQSRLFAPELSATSKILCDWIIVTVYII